MNTIHESLSALILAGTRPGVPDPMAQACGVSHKALIPIGGIPMVLRVIHALQATPGIGRIAVCIDNPDVLTGLVPSDIDILPAAPGGPSASVQIGLTQLGTPLLVTTADSALLRPAWITEFLDHASPEADVSVAVAPQDVVLRDVPGTRRTFIHLSDITFSGCNLFLFRTPASLQIAELWQHVEKNRKHPLRIAMLLGPGILFRALFKKLTRAALCDRVGTLSGTTAELVPLSDGRAAVDVDKPADLELTEKLIAADAAANA